MSNEYEQPQQNCPSSSCHACDGADQDRPPEGGLTGRSLVLRAMIVFVGPLVSAIVGAVVLPVLWRHEASQLLGGFGGLLIGIAEAMMITKLIRAAREKKKV